jgi:hypothetical protein
LIPVRYGSFGQALSASLSDRSSELYWLRAALFEFLELSLNLVALLTVEADRGSQYYQNAARMVFAALIVNAFSLVPLSLLINLLRVDSAIRASLFRSGAAPSKAAAFLEKPLYSVRTLFFSRCGYVLCDLLADYFQFLASLYLGLASASTGSSSGSLASDIVSMVNLISMSFAIAELHQEVILWAGAAGLCAAIETRMSTFLVRGFFVVAMALYVLYLSVKSEATRRDLTEIFAVAIACIIFGGIGVGILIAALCRLCYSTGISEDERFMRGVGYTDKHRTKFNNVNNEGTMGQIFEMCSKATTLL